MCGINFIEFDYHCSCTDCLTFSCSVIRCAVVGTKEAERWASFGSSSFLLMPDMCHHWLIDTECRPVAYDRYENM